MKKRSLGTSEVEITPILLGTWQAGKKMWSGIDDNESIRAIRAGVEAGITTIDTAEVYGEGHSEQIIAQAVGNQRNRVEYASKVFTNHFQYDQVIEACERSLSNLQTDYLDLYQIHWPSGSFGNDLVPISETMQALTQLKEDGKIRAIGVSNFNREQLAEAMSYGRIDSLQPPYSLFWRKIENDAIPYCVEHNIAVLAYSSLAQGLLTGRFSPGHQFEPDDHRSANVLFQGENFERAYQALEQLKPIAKEHDCTLAQLALAWLIAQPQTNAIAGARTVEQAEGNAKAADISLSTEELETIDHIGRQVTDHLDDNPVMWKWS